jgi:ankyrin repeat protein
MASLKGHLDVARLLIEARAAIDKARDDGITPLWVASQNGRLSVVKALLDGGADATLASLGRTPLEIAKGMGYSEIVALL